jgi:4-hydroxythreonine-4-phosphate dehydrogenase
VSRARAVATLAVTSGEPAGIGPDICGALARRRWPVRLVILGDRELQSRATKSPSSARRRAAFRDYAPDAPAKPGVEWLHVPLAWRSVPGRLDPRNASYVLSLLDRAIEGCLSGEFAAMVTAPVHKGVVNDAGIRFSGHTEYLAARTGASLPVMMLTGGGLRVALATTHVPLKRVSRVLTASRLEAVIRVLDADLRRLFGLRRPRILVCGLNPHAGESGHLGREEIDTLAPVIAKLRRRGLALSGPLPADTAFLPERLAQVDAVLAMYHDQGLPVLKYASFGHAVNVTLGLPIVRTSVDHGTALDVAGSGRADPGSLFAAVMTAITLTVHANPTRRRRIA